jgi:hypothetical protein
MNVQASFSLAVFGVVLIGCGGGSPKQVAPAVSPLAGNWLITGPMPTYGITAPGTGVFSLAMSFDVTGSNITASGYGSGFCESNASPPIYNEAFAFEGLTTGVIATDGSFTLQTPLTISNYSLSIQGRVPEMNADQFPGTYAAKFNSPIGPTCDGKPAGMFTATSFPIVSGSYLGTGKFQLLTNGVLTVTPVTIEVTLQQGGAVLDPTTGLSKPSNIAIGGSVRVQGSPCFTSGTANTALFSPTKKPLSSINGNVMQLNFTMDDGSTLTMTGALTDSTESHISASFNDDPFAKGCGAGSSILPSIDLARQS